MKKYIKSYLEINESIGRGSVILIKGKAEGGKKRLYAGHVLGTAEFSHGATMLFLADDFYRIMEEDGRLRAVKIGYRNEDSLKAALNLRSPGKISIVKNNNKTPLHWKTTKHTNVHTALREVESELLSNNYILESAETNTAEIFDSFGNYLAPKILRSIFFKKDEIVFFDKNYYDTLEKKLSDAEDSYIEFEWEAEFKVFDRSPEIVKYLDALNLTQPIDVLLLFNSEFEIKFEYDPGDYWTPPYSEAEIIDSNNKLVDIYIEGTDFPYSEEVKQLVSKINDMIKDYGDIEFKELIKNIKIPTYLTDNE